MKLNITQDKALRWGAQGAIVLLVLVATFAATLYMKVDELETSSTQARAEASKMSQSAAAASKKLQDELKTANAKLADMDARQRETDIIKVLLAKVEPQVAPVLEAAGKAGKPDVRAAVLTGVGLIGQIAHGANHEAALATLDRALALDKGNCVAALAVNLGGAKKIEVVAECQALVPAPAAAAEAKPAAAPAAAAPAVAPAAAPAAAAKAAEPAAK